MPQIILYPHGGSANHGCEALVRSSVKILDNDRLILASRRPEEDSKYSINNICDIVDETCKFKRFSIEYLYASFRYRLLRDRDAFERITYRHIIDAAAARTSIALSFGGDNYCYGKPTYLYIINRLLRELNTPTVLWGCSIEPSNIDDEMLSDLAGYSSIIARESITYNALLEAGLSNATLYPDPAFQLDRVDLPLPEGFVEGNTVGINISPMIMSYEQGGNIAFRNYERLIEQIIEQTDMQIALIPHVVWPNNDDRIPLARLYEKYSHSGRVVMIEDHNCMELKGYIARCRFMVAARTHASIAAYSSCVPTLVVGYSVKAKGIAKDLFGTFENYVLPVQSLTGENELSQAFRWIVDNEKGIRDHLQATMPEYCARALKIKDELQKID